MPCTVAGTGYTGEAGIEIAVPAEAAAALWAAIVGAGVTPAGSGCPRHAPARSRPSPARPRARSGHHLAAGGARLGGGLGQAEFRGREAARAERATGIARRLFGLATDGRRPARAGCAVSIDGVGRRRGDQRQLLADARAWHRVRVPAARHGAGRRRWWSTCAASALRATWWPRRSSAERLSDRSTASPSARDAVDFFAVERGGFARRLLRRRLLGRRRLLAVVFAGRLSWPPTSWPRPSSSGCVAVRPPPADAAAGQGSCRAMAVSPRARGRRRPVGAGRGERRAGEAEAAEEPAGRLGQLGEWAAGASTCRSSLR